MHNTAYGTKENLDPRGSVYVDIDYNAGKVYFSMKFKGF